MQEYETFRKIAESAGKELEEFFNFLANLLSESENEKKVAELFKDHLMNEGQVLGLDMSNEDVDMIQKACNSIKDKKSKEACSANIIFTPDPIDPKKCTMFIRDIECNNFDNLTKYMLENGYEPSFDYKNKSIKIGLEEGLKGEIDEIAVPVEREDLLNAVVTSLHQANIGFYKELHNDSTGICFSRKNAKLAQNVVLKAKNIDGDDAKALITEYYKEINKRDDNEKAMVEKTEKKAKTKNAEGKTK